MSIALKLRMRCGDDSSSSGAGPLFSVVTVSLNPGIDLEKTVASVLSQSFPDYEVINKDGGSSDGSEQTIWSDTRVKRHFAKDAGIYDAMNQALGACSGFYVCFLNAGDLFADRHVLGDVATILCHGRDAEFLYGDIKSESSRAGYTLYPTRLSRYYLYTHMICHQSWFVKRSTMLRYGGFETNCSSVGDYRLLLKMVVRDRVHYRHIPRLVVQYQGQGYSTQSAIVNKAAHGKEEIRSALYTPVERAFYNALWKCRTILKAILYDKYLWRLWRRIRQWRVRNRHS